MKKINFCKMHGLGNDFIIFTDTNDEVKDIQSKVQKLCHRNFGIGADGVMIVKNSDVAHVKMVLFNSDGSRASMCGNGIRCFAKYVWDKGVVRENPLNIETDDGIKIAELSIKDHKVEEIKINMGKYSFESEDVPLSIDEKLINQEVLINDRKFNLTSLHLGVPHTIVFEKINDEVFEYGPIIEKHTLFKNNTNVNFVEVISDKEINVKTWERGAGATLACGTGSSSSVVVCNILGYTGKNVKVNVPGGEMFIEIDGETVYMRGPAVIVYHGEVDIDE